MCPDLEMNTAFQAVVNIKFDMHTSQLTLAQFIFTLLEDSSLKTYPCTLALVKDMDNIITALSQHHDSTWSAFTWANNIVKRKSGDIRVSESNHLSLLRK